MIFVSKRKTNNWVNNCTLNEICTKNSMSSSFFLFRFLSRCQCRRWSHFIWNIHIDTFSMYNCTIHIYIFVDRISNVEQEHKVKAKRVSSLSLCASRRIRMQLKLFQLNQFQCAYAEKCSIKYVWIPIVLLKNSNAFFYFLLMPWWRRG